MLRTNFVAGNMMFGFGLEDKKNENSARRSQTEAGGGLN